MDQRIIIIRQNPKNKKQQRGDAVLDADDFVVRGKDVFPQEAQFLVVRFVGSGMRERVVVACMTQYFGDMFDCLSRY